MNKPIPILFYLLILRLFGFVQPPAAIPDKEYIRALKPKEIEIRVHVSARDSNWQNSSVNLADGETANIRAEGRWGVIDPDNPKRSWSGCGGYGVPAGQNFFKPQAAEGCLLVKVGNGPILNFRNDNDTISVHTPGTIYFVANDDRKPLNGKGFSDNKGELVVFIKISRP